MVKWNMFYWTKTYSNVGKACLKPRKERVSIVSSILPRISYPEMWKTGEGKPPTVVPIDPTLECPQHLLRRYPLMHWDTKLDLLNLLSRICHVRVKSPEIEIHEHIVHENGREVPRINKHILPAFKCYGGVLTGWTPSSQTWTNINNQQFTMISPWIYK